MPLSKPEIVEKLQQIDAYHFEQFISELWEHRGWETEVTGKSNDRGIDVIATKEEPYPEKLIIQAKRHHPSNRVGSPDIQQYSALKGQEENVDKVLIITTSGFTDEALSVANDLNIKCIDGSALANLVGKNNLTGLLESYADESKQTSQQNLERVETVQNSNSTEKPSGESQVTPTDSGDRLAVELTGMKRVETSLSGGFLSPDAQINGFIATFKLYETSSDSFGTYFIEFSDEVNFVDEQGQSYHPAGIGTKHLPDGWTAFGGRQPEIHLPQGASINYVAAVSMPSNADVSVLTIPRHDITIELDYELREQLTRLPDAIQEVI